jgi:hypothetical protein
MSDLVALLTTAEAAKYLRLGAHTLNQMRREHIGPDYIKLGRKVFYKACDLERYISENRITTGE